jgi:HEAT repeat protein
VLIEQLKDPYDGMAHFNAANALAVIGDPSAIGPLIELMKGPSFDGTRESLPGVLVKMGQPAVEPLIAVLHDDNRHARFLAAEALSNMTDPRADKALTDALHEGNSPAIAGASLFFIFRGEPGSEDALIEALDQYGDEQMANLFLNCGNPKLEAAARAWGRKRRWEMQQQVSGLMWGHQPTAHSPCGSDMDD